MSWADAIEDLTVDLAFWYGGTDDPDLPLPELARSVLELGTKFRALAVMQLLHEGNHNIFLHNLARSGRLRLLYLQRKAAESPGIHIHLSGASWFDPLVNSIAALDLSTAREIGLLQSPDIHPGEYEDDHHYGHLLGKLVQDSVPELELTAHLAAFEAFLDGDSSPRYDAMRAIVERDQSDFDDAIAAFIDAFRTGIEEAKARGEFENQITLAQREVCVEALALLRLATLRGLSTADEYDFCPALAREPMSKPFPAV